MLLGPIPQTGISGQVTLDGVDLMLVPGSWKVGEAERFSDKIAQGAITYADFNTYEQAWEVVTLAGGYGLKRVSDQQIADPLRRSRYHEADAVSCREDGIIMLGPLLQVSGTTLTGTPIWIGEYTPSGSSTKVVVVTDDGKIYSVNADFTMTLAITLPAAPRKNAIGTFGSVLIIGYGATRTAQYTTDLATLADVANSTPSNLYVWAVTSDRAASYVAGGPAATDWYKVVSSTTGSTAYTVDSNATKCGEPDTMIQAMAPGGGLAVLFVGKENEVGEIDNDAVWRQLVPMDSRLPTNNTLFRWQLAASGQEQRGPLMIYFNRERSLWSYQPSSQSAGEARNLSPWAQPGLRPDNVRGIPTALRGSARWIYFTITNDLTGDYYLLAQDTRTGAIHGSIATLGTNQVQALAISALVGTSPRLYMGYGNGLATATLPLDGDSPLGNPDYKFAPQGTLELSEIDYDFPDEQKILFVIRMIADNLVPASRYVEVYASYDGADYVLLDTVSNSPAEVAFPAATSVRRVGIKLKLFTDSDLESPQIRAIVLRGSINPKLYRVWEFQARLPAGSMSNQADDLQNPYASINSLWSARTDGIPVTFKDRWGDSWGVRILKIQEQETIREDDRTPETHLSVSLLQVQQDFIGSMIWDDAFAVWDEPTSIWSSA